MLNLNSYFGVKEGKYNKNTAKNVVELQVMCPVGEIMLFLDEKNINFEHVIKILC